MACLPPTRGLLLLLLLLSLSLSPSLALRLPRVHCRLSVFTWQEKMSSDSPTANNDKKNDDAAPVPSEALMTLMAPDGYYVYLNIEKPSSDKEEIDEVSLKKNYRKLSLKHHPDRRGGDEETFRALNRAHRVLLHTKLRQQYDLLGLDLEEDEDHHDHDKNYEEKKDGEQAPPTTPDTIVSHMASAALAAVLQAVVRTVMMGFVAVLVTRYRITVFPAVAFLVYTSFRLKRMQGSSIFEASSPLVIAAGLLLMHYGRTLPEVTWTLMFWIGESLVATMFTFNSLPSNDAPSLFVMIAAIMSALTFWLGGDLKKYLTLIAFQVVLAILLALLFPIMEMLLEAILNEKLRKVGEKVRAQNARMQAYYNHQQSTNQ